MTKTTDGGTVINVMPYQAAGAPDSTTKSTGAAPAGVRNGQMLRFNVMRFNPADPASVPHLQTYELEQTDGMTLFIALNEIREKLDPSLQFDFVCRAGICGSCAMVINGRPGLACRTLAKDVGPEDHAGTASGVRADR